MRKIKTLNELLAYMAGIELPEELKKTAIEKIEVVEECNNGGATAHLLIAQTKADAKQAEKEYALSNFKPESNEFFKSTSGEWWRQSVYVFSDDGSGIIYFERVPLLG